MNSDEISSAEDAAFFNSFLPVVLIRCADCRHWRKIRDEDHVPRGFGHSQDLTVWPGPHGECNRINQFSQDQRAWLHDRPLDQHDQDISLITKPDFGCVLGERSVAPPPASPPLPA